MKWKEFELKHPGLYANLRQFCEDVHVEKMQEGGFSSRFCNYCYDREGWKCLSCNDMRKREDHGW